MLKMDKNEIAKDSIEFIKEQCEKYPDENKISRYLLDYISRSIQNAWDAGKMEVLEKIVGSKK